MKNRLDQCFAKLKVEQKKAFIAYLSAGDPDLPSTLDIVLRLEDQGVDVIELGLPFSDPLADGRVNQEASTRALKAGATFDGVMETVSQIRQRSSIPIIFYAYMNPLLSRGFDQAIKAGAEAGADGFLLLDLPVEESGPYRQALKKQSDACDSAHNAHNTRRENSENCKTSKWLCLLCFARRGNRSSGSHCTWSR